MSLLASRASVSMMIAIIRVFLKNMDTPVKVYREGETVIVLNDEDMEYLDLPTKDNFVVEAIVPFKDVEELTFYADGLYYTAPASAHSARLYSAVVAYLKKTKKCIVGKYTLRTGREIMGLIRVFRWKSSNPKMFLSRRHVALFLNGKRLG